MALVAVPACDGGSPVIESSSPNAKDGGTVARDASPDRLDASVSTDAAPGAANAIRQSYALSITAVDTTFATEDHFIAAVEMQLSGEPFAEAMGRDLGGYSRDYSCPGPVCAPSVYQDPALAQADDGGPVTRIDLAGYSSAIESYEYSK